MQTTPAHARSGPVAPALGVVPARGELWRDPRGDEWLIRGSDRGQLCLTRPLADTGLTGWHHAGGTYTDPLGQNWLPVTGEHGETWLSRPVTETALAGWELAMEAHP
ncbi:MAG: hypothetical protein QOJ50_1908 [Cryptosporangiaceae bacterium]|jgi:hypothetical protein|nr:hypothetical protein [Cryptosporangiaceae bacterium]